MKHTALFIVTIFTLMSTTSFGQGSLKSYLDAVKSNNKTLQSAQNISSVLKAEAKTGLTPNNPEFELGYFPGNSSEIGTKQVIGISQTLDFPTSYIYKNKISNTQQSIADIEFDKNQNQILYEAAQAWLTAVFLNKRAGNYAKRTADAQKLADFYIKKQKSGDATQLEINKAKLFLLTIQNQQRLNLSMQKKNNELIKRLNGGIEFQIATSDFNPTDLKPWPDIQNELDSLLPTFKLFELYNDEAALNLKLNKSAWLPKLMVGYESEEILDDKFSGVKAGISIPLWEHKNTIKKARAEIVSAQSQKDDIVLKYTSLYYSHYLEAETLKQNLDEFKLQLDDMNNEYLLSRSMELGQISSIEYFMELDYFYDILDSYFELELKYQISLNELYKYKL